MSSDPAYINGNFPWLGERRDLTSSGEKRMIEFWMTKALNPSIFRKKPHISLDRETITSM